ncbi:MAG TPA: alpha/beta fold hydrolase [Candidatus Binatus sp.]|jgi:pimeloyl-ACP methyl ester carboxylesterase|nr:alpha/beta fold hydrolase [Candidatus Binatus sp.]
MAWWRAVGGELSALGALALSMPLDLLLPRRPFDPTAPHPTPVVFVHGVCGAASNFLVLRTFLAHRGVRNFASLSYVPRVDYQRMALPLAQLIETVCRDAQTPFVDVVGHSLGGLVARYLVELANESRVRRLVTLGAPYYGERRPSQELAIFAAHDALVPPPADRRSRVMVVEDCGHLNLLRHPAVLCAVARFLCAPSASSWSMARDAA